MEASSTAGDHVEAAGAQTDWGVRRSGFAATTRGAVSAPLRNETGGSVQ